MPDREPEAGHSARLLRGLIWAGVVLAPLAALVVLLGGSSGSVRFAVLLLAVSVVLVGASILIRSDPALQRMDVEDRVVEEVAKLRRELRAEFGHSAARAGGARGKGPSDSGFFRDAPMLPPPGGDPFAPDDPFAVRSGRWPVRSGRRPVRSGRWPVRSGRRLRRRQPLRLGRGLCPGGSLRLRRRAFRRGPALCRG